MNSRLSTLLVEIVEPEDFQTEDPYLSSGSFKKMIHHVNRNFDTCKLYHLANIPAFDAQEVAKVTAERRPIGRQNSATTVEMVILSLAVSNYDY